MTDVAQFKKPKAKARASRLRSEAQSNDIDDTSSDSSGVAVALKVRKQQKERIKPKAKLSFGGDEVSAFSFWRDMVYQTEYASRKGCRWRRFHGQEAVQ